MNGQLSTVFGQPVDAALWSFGSGLLVLTVLLGCSGRVRRGLGNLRAALGERRIRWYHCLGGLSGGLFVVAQTYAVPAAGVALFTIAVVGGQTTSALVVDRMGLGPAGRAPVTVPRVLASALATSGVVIAVGGRFAGASGSVALPVLVAVGVGVLWTAQQATNGRVSVATLNPWSTAWLNFALGSAMVLAILLVRGAAGGARLPSSLDAPWWSWLGGLCGIGFVGISSVVVAQLGVLPVMVVSLVGQLSSAALIDALSPQTRSHITPLVIVGLVVTMVAAALAGVASVRAAGQVGGSRPDRGTVAG